MNHLRCPTAMKSLQQHVQREPDNAAHQLAYEIAAALQTHDPAYDVRWWDATNFVITYGMTTIDIDLRESHIIMDCINADEVVTLPYDTPDLLAAIITQVARLRSSS
jgi:hypothetical protein